MVSSLASIILCDVFRASLSASPSMSACGHQHLANNIASLQPRIRFVLPNILPRWLLGRS